VTNPLSNTPSSCSTQSTRATASVSLQDYGPPARSAPGALYSSPYYTQPSTTSHPVPIPLAAGAPVQSVSVSNIAPNTNGDQQHSRTAQGPPLQPASSIGVVLSRNRETKILLSIDGDGVRGLSALLLIESLVNAICVKLGQRLDPHQIFDLTGGSSLGGVIAILLCRLQMQAHRAREAYKCVATVYEPQVRHTLTSFTNV
jgi:hypothetical protein